MATIDLSDFAKHLQHLAQEEVDKFLKEDAVRLAASVFENQMSDAFQTESFNSQYWQEVKRRTPGTSAYRYAQKRHPARLSRKILTGDTGDLGRSFHTEYTPHQATFTSDTVYGKVHNEGLKAGRGQGFTMPKRQFIGSTPETIKQAETLISDHFKSLFNQ